MDRGGGLWLVAKRKADEPCSLPQIVDKTIMEADLDKDGKISFEEFTKMVENTDVSMSMTLGISIKVYHDVYDTDSGRSILRRLFDGVKTGWLGVPGACGMCIMASENEATPSSRMTSQMCSFVVLIILVVY